MRFALLIAGLAAGACALAETPVAEPMAARKPHVVRSANGDREDPWYWLRDDTRSDPEVLGYLRAENAWYEDYRQRYAGLEKTLEAEMIARLPPADDMPPWHKDRHWYYTRIEPGKDFPLFARKAALDGAEEVLLDGNEEARRASYYRTCASAVSPDENLLAFGADVQGRYQCTLRIRDLRTGKDYPEVVTGTNGSIAWAADNRTLFYVENDPVTLLSTRVRKHVLGTDPRTDRSVYEEQDRSFYIDVASSSDDAWLMIDLHSTTATEVRVLAAGEPDGDFAVIVPRQRDFLYDADHAASRWVIRHNGDAPNYRLQTASDAEVTQRGKWRDLVAHDAGVFIEDFQPFRDHVAISYRADGLLRLRVIDWDGGNSRLIGADEAAYTTWLDRNAETDTEWLRYAYGSLTTPDSIYDINMRTQERILRKRTAVPGGYDSANYVTERLVAPARDGTKIPVSLVYRKGFSRDGTAPLVQYAYGAYGASIDPGFNSDRVSLLDRGVVYAIAHVRGGQEMGRSWYDDGHLFNKKNSFTDFIDVSEFLVAQKYAAPDKVLAMGASAGGLLMGAIFTMRPDLYRGVLAQVPFVDVVTTMLDESIPLVTNEFDEWGNPKDKRQYDYLLSYSPYDNVRARDYPALLVTTGLNDSQVQYYEPTKWVAKLRNTRTGKAPLLLRVNMQAGHGGKSGRLQSRSERAQDYAFLLDLVGIKE